MKSWLSVLALALVLACVAAVAVGAGLRHPVPSVVAGVALAALAGQLALFRLPSASPIIIAIGCVIAIAVLSGIGVAVPDLLVGLLVAAVTGHYALGIPVLPSSSPAAPPVETPTPAPLVDLGALSQRFAAEQATPAPVPPPAPAPAPPAA